MVNEIFTWADPIKSGLVFGSLNLFFILTVLMETPVISVVCNVFAVLSVVGIVISYMGKEDQVTEDDDYEYISRESFEDFLVFVESYISTFTGTSDMSLVQAFLGFFVLYYVGMLFSLGALLWLATIVAFTLPIVYS